jgi:hypothetical protein
VVDGIDFGIDVYNVLLQERTFILSMRWEYISELLLPGGLLFISQVHGEPLWNGVVRGIVNRQQERSLAILPSEPSSSKSGTTLGCHSIEIRRIWAQEIVDFFLRNVSFMLAVFFNKTQNLTTYGLRLNFPSEGAADFYRP